MSVHKNHGKGAKSRGIQRGRSSVDSRLRYVRPTKLCKVASCAKIYVTVT